MNFKMIVAIIFLILLLTCGILQEYYVRGIFADFETMLEEIANTSDGYYNLDLIIETKDWWDKKHKKMELFLPHIPLNEIAASLGELKGAAQVENFETATALLNRLFALTESISEMSSIRIGNIL